VLCPTVWLSIITRLVAHRVITHATVAHPATNPIYPAVLSPCPPAADQRAGFIEVGFEYEGILLTLARHLCGDSSLACFCPRPRSLCGPDVVGTSPRGIWQPQQEFVPMQRDASPQHIPDSSQKASAKDFSLWSDSTSAPATMPHSDVKEVSSPTVQQQLQTPRQVLPHVVVWTLMILIFLLSLRAP
jgi:hypothetical protein